MGKFIDEGDFARLVAEYDRPDFFFVQVGANDGITDDALRSFVLAYRWRGLLIEPLPDVFEKLRKNYSDQDGLCFANVAIAGVDGPIVFQRHPTKPQCSGIGVRTRIQKRAKMKTVVVEGITFPHLLDKFEINRIDLLQIDVEGYDGDIVLAFPFGRINPQIIRYEHKHLKDRADLEGFLEGKGYMLFHERHDTVAVQHSAGECFTDHEYFPSLSR